jgi:hypothetical protein
MKTRQFFALVGVLVLILGAILFAVPATNHLVRGILNIFVWIWKAVSGLLVLAMVLGFGPLFGFVAKGFFMAWVDSYLEKNQEIAEWMHTILAVVFGILAGIVFALLMPVIMGWETWLRWVSMELGWSGAYEIPPLVWGIYSAVMAGLFYKFSPYLLKEVKQLVYEWRNGKRDQSRY